MTQFILGHIYYYLYCFKLLPKYIGAQFTRRLENRSCVNTCLYECQGCGCSIPEVLFAPKACKKGNYPALIWDKKSWEILSKSIHDFEINSIAECKKEFKRINPHKKEDEIKYIIYPGFYGNRYDINPIISSVTYNIEYEGDVAAELDSDMFNRMVKRSPRYLNQDRINDFFSLNPQLVGNPGVKIISVDEYGSFLSLDLDCVDMKSVKLINNVDRSEERI